MKYGDTVLELPYQTTLGIIDTGNFYIHLPTHLYEKVLATFQAQDETIHEDILDGKIVIVSEHKCDDLMGILSPLEFTFDNIVVEISPGGFLFSHPI